MKQVTTVLPPLKRLRVQPVTNAPQEVPQPKNVQLEPINLPLTKKPVWNALKVTTAMEPIPLQPRLAQSVTIVHQEWLFLRIVPREVTIHS